MRGDLRLSTRLLAAYAMLVAATILVVGGIVVLLTRSFFLGALDDELSAAVESFREEAASDLSAPHELAARTEEWLGRTAFTADQVVAVRTGKGRILSSAGGLDLDAIPATDTLLGASEARWWWIERPDAARVRALSVPVVLEGRQIGTIVAAASQSSVDSALSALLSGVAAAAVIGLALSALIGRAVIRRTLRPLETMAGDIQTIQDTGDLSLRVPETGPQDEVGRVTKAFNRMIGTLQEAFASQRRFLSDASHELGAPLTVARGRLELHVRKLRDPRDKHSLTLAFDELDRAGRIVDELLLLARLDEGLRLVREPVEVELIVREALLRAMLLEPRDVKVAVEPGQFVIADQDRLLQVVTNLMTNAVRHTDSDVGIAVSTCAKGDAVVLEVADNGPGIPPDELPHIFDRLYRGSAAKRGSSGAGLGLAIVAALVGAMGGNIDVSSGMDGTRFVISLPRADAPVPR
ncbi:MAG: sensor histidine kinase [Actinomycetota bacterium]